MSRKQKRGERYAPRAHGWRKGLQGVIDELERRGFLTSVWKPGATTYYIDVWRPNERPLGVIRLSDHENISSRYPAPVYSYYWGHQWPGAQKIAERFIERVMA